MSDEILVCKDLAKTFIDGASRIEVLRNINLTIYSGEMVAIVGSSGSGKSTLLQLLAGLDQASGGDVFLQGKSLFTVNEKEKCHLRNRYLGFVYQFHHLLPEFTALENVGMPLLLRGSKPSEIEARAKELLTQVGLSGRLSHRLGQLSGGERQRVAIARALVAKPLCVLADEPTGNLDPKNAEKVLKLFLELQQLHQTSVVMVTHDPNIARLAKRTLTIENGVLVQ